MSGNDLDLITAISFISSHLCCLFLFMNDFCNLSWFCYYYWLSSAIKPYDSGCTGNQGVNAYFGCNSQPTWLSEDCNFYPAETSSCHFLNQLLLIDLVGNTLWTRCFIAVQSQMCWTKLIQFDITDQQSHLKLTFKFFFANCLHMAPVVRHILSKWPGLSFPKAS